MSAQMFERGAKQDIQISVGADLSTVVLGGTKVEVASDGKKVTAYTNEGIETKASAAGAVVAEGTQISINKEFNAVVLNGVTIEQAADGHLVISAPGGTVITKPAPANDTAKSAVPEIGDVMPAGHKNAGWVYAGISKTTSEPFYSAAEDSGVFKWNAAMKFAAQQNARVPSDEELNQLFEAKDEGALKGTFNVSGSYPAGWYCSSTELHDLADYAWDQRFDDGTRIWHYKDGQSSLRLVRS
jgi:hypothetical protein